MKNLIGMRVLNKKTHQRGIVSKIKDSKIFVLCDDELICYPYPAAFADTLLLEDVSLQQTITETSYSAQFDTFKNIYTAAIR